MKTIEVDITVVEDGRIEGQAPPDLAPGRYKVAVPIQPETEDSELLGIPVIHVDHWPEGLSLRREDMYGDDGR